MVLSFSYDLIKSVGVKLEDDLVIKISVKTRSI